MTIRGAKAIVVNDKGDALVVRRSHTHPHAPLTSDLPGGKVEDGETMVQGLLREVQEETGVVVASGPAVSLIGSREEKGYYGKDYYIELYEIKLDIAPKITLSFEHDMYEWVSIQELKIVGELFEPLVEAYRTASLTIVSGR